MFKKSILVVVSIAILSVAYAQAQSNFGVRAGLNFANMKFSGDGFSASPDMKIGFQLGVVGEFSVNESFAIQPGILLAQQGFQIKIVDEKVSMSLNYLQVPVNITFNADLGGANLLLHAGPYFGYGLFGKAKYDGESTDIKFGSGKDANLKAPDFGFGFGAGVQFGAIQTGIGYNIGLLNLYPGSSSDGVKMKNKCLALTVTYLFGK